jgi:hypothetical protein
MKPVYEYVCVEVGHHMGIADAIAEYEEQGWHLHTYQAAGKGAHDVSHYLLFERERTA